MREFTINKNDAGQRFDKFLTKSVPLLPKNLMYKYIRTKRLKVNGKRADRASVLNEGDVVSLYINDEFFGDASDGFPHRVPSPRVQPKPEIIYEDENILVVNKPAGLPVHSAADKRSDTLIDRVKFYLFERGEYLPEAENSFAPAACNRLDVNTRGLVICAKNAAALREMNAAIAARQVRKKYLCLTAQKPPKSADVITAYHRKTNHGAEVFSGTADGAVNSAKDCKEIITAYKVLGRVDLSNVSPENIDGFMLKAAEEKVFVTDGDGAGKEPWLLEVELITGRKHQIRAHLAHMGCGIIGDKKYGKSETNRLYKIRTQALCAYSIEFDFPPESTLCYLNSKKIEITPADNIWERT